MNVQKMKLFFTVFLSTIAACTLFFSCTQPTDGDNSEQSSSESDTVDRFILYSASYLDKSQNPAAYNTNVGIQYTSDYSSAEDTSLYESGYTVSFIKDDFDSKKNAYVLSKKINTTTKANTYTMYKFSATNGSKEIITLPSTVTYNSNTVAVLPVQFAVDRKTDTLYFIMTGTVSNVTSYFIVQYTLSSTTSEAKATSISIQDVGAISLTAYNGTLYWINQTTSSTVLNTSTYANNAWTTNNCTLTLDSNYFKLDDDPLKFTLTPNNYGTYYAIIKDITYTNDSLWILISNTSECGDWRGGLVKITPSDIASTTSYTIPSSTVTGWTTNAFKTTIMGSCNYYRPGVPNSTVNGAKDDLTAVGFAGPIKFVCVTSKKLYIADDGYYMYDYNDYKEGENNYTQYFKRRNRVGTYSIDSGTLDMNDVKVEFDSRLFGGGTGFSYSENIQ